MLLSLVFIGGEQKPPDPTAPPHHCPLARTEALAGRDSKKTFPRLITKRVTRYTEHM